MNKELAAQFLSAIITRNSGQRIEDDVKEALAYAETFERLTADYTTPQVVQYAVSGSDFSIKADDKSCEWEDGFTATFKKSSSDDLIQNPPLKQERWTLRFNGTDGEFYTKQYRNDTLACLLDSYAKSKKITFLVAADNGILSTWEDKGRIFSFYSDAKHVHVIPCFSEREVKEQIDAYYEERGGFAKHVEYLKSIGQW